jgi:hypothetical protein
MVSNEGVGIGNLVFTTYCNIVQIITLGVKFEFKVLEC